jgi:hypothetical protein
MTPMEYGPHEEASSRCRKIQANHDPGTPRDASENMEYPENTGEATANKAPVDRI